jgi:hypothetical protein
MNNVNLRRLAPVEDNRTAYTPQGEPVEFQVLMVERCLGTLFDSLHKGQEPKIVGDLEIDRGSAVAKLDEFGDRVFADLSGTEYPESELLYLTEDQAVTLRSMLDDERSEKPAPKRSEILQEAKKEGVFSDVEERLKAFLEEVHRHLPEGYLLNVDYSIEPLSEPAKRFQPQFSLPPDLFIKDAEVPL